MQFQVPQFIETEDKIVGPLTLKQFGYIGGAATVVGLLFLVLNFFLWLLIAGIFGAIASARAVRLKWGDPADWQDEALLRVLGLRANDQITTAESLRQATLSIKELAAERVAAWENK